MPWWLDEGVATLVGSGLDGGDGHNDARLPQVIEWEAAGALAPWEDMAVFEETPVELWAFVYPQGYAMAAFVTERFGADRRNDWLAAMATEMDIDEATPAELGRIVRRARRRISRLARQTALTSRQLVRRPEGRGALRAPFVGARARVSSTSGYRPTRSRCPLRRPGAGL